MRSMKAVVAATALAMLALSACSTGGGTTANGQTIVNLLGPEDPSTFAPVIQAFEGTHPDMIIDYSQVPFDQLNNTIQQRLGAKDQTIDLFTVDQPRVAQLAAQGYLEDLSDLSDRARAATSSAQFEANIFRGRLWALPVWNSTQMMFVNLDALDAAGVEAPSSDPSDRWTWEKTVEAGIAAQQAGTQWAVLLEQTEFYYQLQPLMESQGGGSGVSGDGLVPDVDNQGWIDAMTWYGKTFADGLSPRGVGSFETSPLFRDGKVAFFIGGPWDIAGFADADVNWRVVPHPYFEDGHMATPTGSWSWGINPASPDKDAARQFLEFAALDPTGNLATTETQTIIPSNSQAAVSYMPRLDALAGEKSRGVADLIQYEIDNTAVPRPVTVGYIQFEEVMNRAFADIRNGADPSTRLAQASLQLEDAWKVLR